MGQASSDLVIVEGGQARARIVLDERAAPSAKFAARELRLYIEKSTGARLPMAPVLQDDGRPEIILGEGPAAREMELDARDLPRDAFRIKTIGTRIAIVGRDDREWDPASNLRKLPRKTWHNFEHATIFGVYEFLERFLGIRWYLPIDIGEVVPRREALVIPSVDLVCAPKKIGRFTHNDYGADEADQPPRPRDPTTGVGEGYVPDVPDLRAFAEARNRFFLRMCHETCRMVGNHTMWRIIHPKRYAPTNPEYFALLENGKRCTSQDVPPRSHHCFSHPKVIDRIVEVATAYFRGEPPRAVGLPSWEELGRETPWGRTFQLMQDDGFKGCYCDQCRPAVRHDAEGQFRWSNVVWKAWRQVAKRVQLECPEGVLSIWAYGPTTVPPKEPLPGNVIYSLATQGPYVEFVEGAAERERTVIETWCEIAGRRNISFANYALWGGWEHGRYFSHKSICGSIPRAYAAYYQRYRDHGCGHYMYILPHRYAYDHLSIFVYYKLLWDPGLDIDDLLNEYYALFYGPGAEPMGKFWEEVEQAYRRFICGVRQTPQGPRWEMADPKTTWEKIYNRKTIERWKSYFDDARSCVAGAADIYGRRVDYMRRNVLDTIVEGLEAYEHSPQDAA